VVKNTSSVGKFNAKTSVFYHSVRQWQPASYASLKSGSKAEYGKEMHLTIGLLSSYVVL